MELRKWRLYRMRALRIEPFKIFPNKTLCQLIRKRRNDVCWAADAAVKVEPAGQTASTETTPSGEQPGSTATGSVLTSQAEEEDNSLQDVSPTAFSESISHDLVSCFGIGPSKVKAGGFAWEALTVLNRTSISCLLEKSRNLNSG